MPALGVIDSLCSVCHMVSLTNPLWSVIASRGLLDLCPEITSVLISCLFNLSNLPLINLLTLLARVVQRMQDKACRDVSFYHQIMPLIEHTEVFWGKRFLFYNKLLVACLVCFCTLLGGLIWGEENSAWPRPLWHTICYPGPFTFWGLLISSFSFFSLSKMSLKLEAFIVRLTGKVMYPCNIRRVFIF